jgi:hypothetical protein
VLHRDERPDRQSESKQPFRIGRPGGPGQGLAQHPTSVVRAEQAAALRLYDQNVGKPVQTGWQHGLLDQEASRHIGQQSFALGRRSAPGPTTRHKERLPA